MKPTTFAIRGTVCFSTDSQNLTCLENAFIVCQDGRTVGVFPELPAQFEGIPVEDVGDSAYHSGNERSPPSRSAVCISRHVYGSGTAGMAESRLLSRRKPAMQISVTPRKPILSLQRICARVPRHVLPSLATLHVEATELLMDLMEKTGLKTYIGKVNMDRNGTAEPSGKKRCCFCGRYCPLAH